MAQNGMNKEERKLYAELQRDVKKANQRILDIERQFGKGSWAVRNLYNRLESEKVQALTKSGRISLSQSMSKAQLKAIQSATEKFLNSKTSTITGIKQTRESVKDHIGISADITFEEADIIQQIWEDSKINTMTKYLKGSDFINFISDMVEESKKIDSWPIEEGESKVEYNRRIRESKKAMFMNRLEAFVDNPHADKKLKSEASRIVSRYMK